MHVKLYNFFTVLSRGRETCFFGLVQQYTRKPAYSGKGAVFGIEKFFLIKYDWDEIREFKTYRVALQRRTFETKTFLM
jgi:hypothetical protein